MNNCEIPELEVVRFDAEDVVVTSMEFTPDPDELPIIPFNLS